MRAVTAILLALSTISCDGDPTVRPTPPVPNPSPAPVPGLTTYRVNGLVVDERGTPVSGADLIFHGSGRSGALLTDANGAYDVTIELRQRGTDVTVRKPGYEPSRFWVSLDAEKVTSRNFKLHDIQSIAAGQSLRLALNLDDPGCGYELYICRRVRISSVSRGTMTVVVAPDNAAAQFGVVTAGQDPGSVTSTRLAMPVTAGAEAAIDVVIFAGRLPEAFTLNTSFEPR